MENEMTPTQALNILDKATENLSGSRMAHLQILAALRTLRELVAQDEQSRSEPPEVEPPTNG